jgi:hypothetical protein
VLVVLAIFFAGIVASSIAPLIDTDHGAEHGSGELALAGSDAAAPDGAPASDGAACNHACHFLQHLQGSVDPGSTLGVSPSADTHATIARSVPPPLFLDTHLRPPRVSARFV